MTDATAPETPQDLLSVRHLTVEAHHGGRDLVLVNDVSFAVEAGRTHGLVGASGSGKTMSALAVSGLLPPGVTSRGSVKIQGQELSDLSRREARALRTSRIGFVFQSPKTALNPRLTVGDQVREALTRELRLDEPAALRRALELFDEVGIPRAYDRLSAYPHELSGGLAQRVVIAMALARDPLLLIADEPTTALDATIQAQILDLIDAIQARRRFGVLLITHDIGVILDRADDLTVMADHKVVEQGLTRDIVDNPQTEATKVLLEGATLGQGELADEAQPEAEPIFRADQASRTFVTSSTGRRIHVKALDDVTLAVRVGQSVGIVGESGSGKTTFARCLVGLEHLDEGAITFHGRPLSELGRREERTWRTEVQFIFQDPWSAFNPHDPVIDSVAEPLRALKTPKAERRAAVLKALADVAFPTELAGRIPGKLSGGQLQRAAIARALVVEPKLLIADEAVSSLDVAVQTRIIDLLAELKKTRQLTYVFISHDLRVVKRLCEHVVVMRDGRIVEAGSARQVFNRPTHPYTRELLDAVPGAKAALAAWREH
ncbi:MAG: ABC transporter ATP-binding protein [Propionibacteriaceae bacterium]|jgi:peptide/nickel transport system ATP-binding protein|nr:ABC transporter ATP-binding protein [Propionibacteriaceae bacterium]